MFALTLAMGLVLTVCVASRSAARDDTILVSRASGANGVKGNAMSSSSWGVPPSISADGRVVAFDSEAWNLAPVERGIYSYADVFLRDLLAETTLLVSRASGVAGASSSWFSGEPSVSADGRFVAFASGASNLDPDDTDGEAGVFMRDLQTSTTVLVSRASGAAGAKGEGWSPSISADGRFVAFTSGASNLNPDDRDGEADVFVRDLRTNTTVLVSRASGAAGADGNRVSYGPSISADGRFVAFTSDAPNLVPNDSDTRRLESDVFLRDLQTDTTRLVSRPSGPASANGNGWDPSVSANGRFVAFVAPGWPPNDDGELNADVFVRELRTRTTVLVSRASGHGGADSNNESSQPSISADGRFVAFTSFASNLHPYDSDIWADVFVRDLRTRTTVLVSRASGDAGAKGNDNSDNASISADGRFVAFASGATNLHPDDHDDHDDVFVRELGPPPLAGPPHRYCDGTLARIVVLPGSPSIEGTSRGDVIVGSRRADRIDASGGNDLICARDGHDSVRGGAGNDRLRGDAGDDVIDGRAGHDRIFGGRGNDFIPTAGRFADHVDCGPGRDRAIVDRLDRVRRCERVRVRKLHARP